MNSAKTTENLQTDILVIGGGGSGMTAALAAAEAGIKNIIVLEKADKAGGNASLASGIFAVESPVQKRMGVKLTRDQVWKYKMEDTDWNVDARLVRNFVNKTGEIIQWLEDKGIRFDAVQEPISGQGLGATGHDCGDPHAPGAVRLGTRFLEMALRYCQEYGIQVLLNTPAKEIIIDSAGKVNGVLASSADKDLNISAKAVIIVSGGFGNNKDMLKRFFPTVSDMLVRSLPQSMGDGIMMAEEIGAVVDDQVCRFLLGPVFPRGIPFLPGSAIFVNKHGERFLDESMTLQMGNNSVNNSVIRQPGEVCYALVDSKIRNNGIEQDRPSPDFAGGPALSVDEAFEKAVNDGKAVVSDSLEEIAKFIGAKPEVLQATVDRYNTFCKKGSDMDFCKDSQYLQPLLAQPYYAGRSTLVLETTFGGIKINHRFEVINKNDNVMDGLYAAGDTAGSWASMDRNLRYGASALSFSLSSGFLAGENAAKYVQGK